MISNYRDLEEYKDILNGLLEKRAHPLAVSIKAKPHNTIEVMEYHKWCLNVFLANYYELRLKTRITVIPFEDRKKSFLTKFYNTPNKSELLTHEKSAVREEIRMVAGNFKYAGILYEQLRTGSEENIYKVPYTNVSYKIFQQYALVYDLVKYKVYLDTISIDIEPFYKGVRFNLTPSQLDYLYNSLIGVYIHADTELSDFYMVFNLNRVEPTKRMKWINMSSRNRTQLNKATLFRLIIELNELDSYLKEQLKPEVYAFINSSFTDQEGNAFKDLSEAHRSYKREGETNAVMAITSLIRNIKPKKK